jgi:hypothetical protein
MRIGGKAEALEAQAVLEEHPFACGFAEALRKAMVGGVRAGAIVAWRFGREGGATFTEGLGDAKAWMGG